MSETSVLLDLLMRNHDTQGGRFQHTVRIHSQNTFDLQIHGVLAVLTVYDRIINISYSQRAMRLINLKY